MRAIIILESAEGSMTAISKIGDMDVMTICVVGFRSVQICQSGKRIRLKSSPVILTLNIHFIGRQESLPEPMNPRP